MKYLPRVHRRIRRGVSTVQWCLIAAVITIVVIASIRSLGEHTNTRMENTGNAVADPAELKNLVGS